MAGTSGFNEEPDKGEGPSRGNDSSNAGTSGFDEEPDKGEGPSRGDDSSNIASIDLLEFDPTFPGGRVRICSGTPKDQETWRTAEQTAKWVRRRSTYWSWGADRSPDVDLRVVDLDSRSPAPGEFNRALGEFKREVLGYLREASLPSQQTNKHVGPPRNGAEPRPVLAIEPVPAIEPVRSVRPQSPRSPATPLSPPPAYNDGASPLSAANFGNPGQPETASVTSPGPSRLRPELPDDKPPQAVYSDTVERFGVDLEGRQSLWHIPGMPGEAVTRVREQVAREVEGARGRNEEFRHALATWMTPELLLAEWARLRSRSGLPVDARYMGERRPASLRLRLRLIGPGDPKMGEQPDGPPVGIQRWAFGGAEQGSTATDSEFRPSLNPAFMRSTPISLGALREVTVTPRLALEYGQLAVQSTAAQSHDWGTVLAKSGGALPYDYAPQWELRLGDPLAVLWSGRVPTEGWFPLGLSDGPETPLTVWFPPDATVPGPLPVPDPRRPDTVPAPLDALHQKRWHSAFVSGPETGVLLAGVVGAFPDLKNLSEESREVLAEFLSEGSIRSSLPRAWGRDTDADTVSSPTLYLRSGKPLYLRFRVSLSGETKITGPTAEQTVLENFVVRAQRAAANATLTDALGFQLPVQFTTGREISLTVQPGYQHTFAHTLGSGSSSRVAKSLSTAQDLHHVTPTATFHWELVRPREQPLEPVLRRETSSRVQMLVPSLAAVTGSEGHPRHLPPELLHLRGIPLSATPLEVKGTEQLFEEAKKWLHVHGYLPSSDRPRLGRLKETIADKVALLDNERKFMAFFSGVALLCQVDEMAAFGTVIWLANGGNRVVLRLEATRNYSPGENVVHEGTYTDVSVTNFFGSTGLGSERSTGRTGQFNLTVTAVKASLPYVQSVSPDVVGTLQQSRAVTSSSGTDSEIYLHSPPGAEYFSVPAEYKLSINDSSGAQASWKSNGSIRIAVPTDLTLPEPDESEPPPVVTRSVNARDLEVLERPGDGPHYDGRILRLPQSALIQSVGGSKQLIEAVFDLLNGVVSFDAAAEPAPGAPAAAVDDPDREADVADQVASVPGHYPPDEPAGQGMPTEPAPGALAAAVDDPDREADVADQVASVPGHYPPDEPAGQRMQARTPWLYSFAFGNHLIWPESRASEFFTVSLSPVSLMAHFERILNNWVIEGPAERGIVAGTTHTLSLRAYIEDPKFSGEVPVSGEWWRQSNNSVSVTDTGQRTGGGGLTLSSTYGKPARSFKPSLTYNLSRTVAEGETRSLSTGVWRMPTEHGAVAYSIVATVVIVLVIDVAVRNTVKYAVAPGPRRRLTVALQVPRGIKFMLFANDFNAHPELSALLPPGLLPVPPIGPDRPLPDRYIRTGGALGFGVVTDVEIKGKRGALETAIIDAVNSLAPNATADGHFASLDGLKSRINQLATAEGLSSVINAGPDGWVVFHWVRRTMGGHEVVRVALGARTRQSELVDVRGRLLADSSGMETATRSATGQGSALQPGVVAISRTRHSRSHGFSFSPLTGEDNFSEGPSIGWTLSPSLAYSLSSAREERTWQVADDRTVGYRVPYRILVDARAWPLTDSAFGWLMTQTKLGLSSALNWMGLAAWLKKQGVLSDTPRGRHSELAAVVSLRFSNAETQPDHTTSASVRPQVETQDPVPVQAAVDMGLSIPRELHERLTDQGRPRKPWRPARPIAVYGFDAVDELRKGLRAVSRRPGTDPTTSIPDYPPVQPSFTRSAETINIVLQTWAQARGEAVPLDDATVMLILGSSEQSGISSSLDIYDPKIVSSSRGMDIGLNLTSSDRTGTTATVTSSPSVTFGVNTPVAGRDLDVVRNQSMPFLGGNSQRGQTTSNYSARTERSRIGIGSGKRGRQLMGHVVSAVAVIKISGPEPELSRWVVGNFEFRTTENITDGAAGPVAELRAADGAAGPVAESRVPDGAAGPVAESRVPDGAAGPVAELRAPGEVTSGEEPVPDEIRQAFPIEHEFDVNELLSGTPAEPTADFAGRLKNVTTSAQRAPDDKGIAGAGTDTGGDAASAREPGQAGLAEVAGVTSPDPGSSEASIAEVLRFAADGPGRRLKLPDLATKDQIHAIAERGGLVGLDEVEALAIRIAAAFTDPADGLDGPPADVALTLVIPAGRTPDSITSSGQIAQAVATKLKHPVFIYLEGIRAELKICR
jgi:hypothetical protein